MGPPPLSFFILLGLLYQGHCQIVENDWKNHFFGFTGLVGQGPKVFPNNSTYSLSLWDSLTKTKKMKLDELNVHTIGAEVRSLHYQYLDKRRYDPYKPDAIWVKHYERWGKEYVINAEGPKNHVISFFEDPFGDWFLTRHTYSNPSPGITLPDRDTIFQVTPDPLYIAPEPQSKSNLKVMSYNIWNFNPLDGKFSKKMELIVKQVKLLDPDVIGFQEVRFSNVNYPGNKNGIQIEYLAKNLPEYQFVFQPAHFEFPLGLQNMEYTTIEGVAIFSKYPIIKTGFINLSRNFSDFEDAHQRVCLGALIQTPIGDISIFTTHFSLSAIARKRNIVEIYEFVATFPHPAIILGDFNSEPESLEYEFLLGRFELGGFKPQFHDAFDWLIKKENLLNKQLQLDQGWTYTTIEKEPKKRIDFIFYESPLIVLTYEMGDLYKESNVYASDHRPILATFQWHV